VVRETGTREIDRMGGLARQMPRTAAAFLIGAVAIVGLPPLNGFVSEWTLVQGFLGAGRVVGPLRWLSLGAASLGLVAALALACFARLVGAVFLGQPREPHDSRHQGPGPADGLALPLGLLGVLCLAIGVAPGLVLGLAWRVAGSVSGSAVATGGLPLDIDAPAGLRWFGISVLVAGLGTWVLRGARRGTAPRRTAVTWGCAYPETTSRMQYTASSFGAPILGAFRVIPSTEVAGGSSRADGSAGDRILRGVVLPLWSTIRGLALALRPLQQGRVTTYLQYIVWTLLLMLGFLMFAASRGRP
jgi:NADH:ubiquinone oxidoreductase subunit 5 (subunit L)/multisubunit Na+/H+ antiporter MnhA subunit